METLTVQVHHTGDWHDAALVQIDDERAGIRSGSTLDYVMDYVVTWDAEGLAAGAPARDRRAVSVAYPTDFSVYRRATWPPFLLDMLPQGMARARLARRLGHENPDTPEVEYPLLLQGGGTPIGNLRIKEAWEAERRRLEAEPFTGLELRDILERTERFADMVDRFILIASGSSGVQGDWPKALLTQADDGLWYPEPLVEDARARDHVIVKLLRDRDPDYAQILASEGPYLEVAREFGLRVGRPLRYADAVLVIPRFDREVAGGRVVRHGQESLVSAIGVAEMGHLAHHEDYLAVIKDVSTDPAAEVLEYVLRDVLNFAMGNPDNHGRNTALRKQEDGWIGLTPLFDFAPMRLDPQLVVRSARWRCLEGRDADPDWGLVCEAAAKGVMEPVDLRGEVAAKADLLRAIPEVARRLGVPDRAIEVACAGHEDAARRAQAAGVVGR